MDNALIITGLASIFASAAPLIFAVVGETFTERSGVINLSLNGMILLSAMASFTVALQTNSMLLGFVAGAAVGALVALLVAFASITLKQSQVAVGFVLALLCRDLAYFLGNPVNGMPGPRLNPLVILPLLSDIPLLGELFFKQDVMTYLSYVLIFAAWFFIFHTRPGLMLQAVGERPAAAYVRGANVQKMRYFYTVLGGALVGLSGPMYSLSIKAGWAGTISGLDGLGWIALAITIFGGWNPLRAAFGVYLFAFLQWLGLVLQSSVPNIPSQVLQVAPFPLMILTLLLVNIGNTEWVDRMLAGLPPKLRNLFTRMLRSMRSNPPAAMGTPFEKQ